MEKKPFRHPSFLPDHVAVAQVQLVGKERNRQVGTTNMTLLKYTSRVVVGINETTGRQVALPATKTNAVISDLPHYPINTAQQVVDLAQMEGPTIAQVRKNTTTTYGVNTEKKYEKSGAVPGYRIPKKGGFFSFQEQMRVADIRKNKKYKTLFSYSG